MQTHEITQESSQDQFDTWMAAEEARTAGNSPEPTEETPKAAEEPKTPEPEPEAEQPAEPEEAEEKVSGEQKRINRLTAEKYKAQAERDLLKAQIEELKGKPTEPKAEKKEAAEPLKSGPVEPQLKDFADWDEYQVAQRKYVKDLVEFTTAETISKVLADRDQKQAKTTQEQQAQASETAWKTREKEFATKNPDYFEAVHRPDLKISNVAASAIVGEENGTDIVYFLGKNQAEADRIHGLNDIEQAKAIGKLSERLARTEKPKDEPTPKKRSEAPAPPNLVSGRSAPPDVIPDASDYAAFERYELKHFPPKRR